MINHPINDERLAQTNDDVFTVAQDAVNLAVTMLSAVDADGFFDATALAVMVLKNYADWRNINLPTEIREVLEKDAE